MSKSNVLLSICILFLLWILSLGACVSVEMTLTFYLKLSTEHKIYVSWNKSNVMIIRVYEIGYSNKKQIIYEHLVAISLKSNDCKRK